MHFHRSVSILVGFLSVAVVNGLPTDAALSRRDFGGHRLTGCDISRVVLPESDGTTVLDKPDKGLKLTRVVIGRGTQNYTCADSSGSTAPASAGATAILYDASCVAANYLSFLHKIPNALISLPENLDLFTVGILQRFMQQPLMVGHHYFVPDFTTPVFDFRLTQAEKKIFTGKKDQGVPAMTTAVKGTGPDQDFGAVDWLRLKAIPAKTVDYKLAYRIHTAGGKAPSTCEGRPSSFTIQYAAEYWFYN